MGTAEIKIGDYKDQDPHILLIRLNTDRSKSFSQNMDYNNLFEYEVKDPNLRRQFEERGYIVRDMGRETTIKELYSGLDAQGEELGRQGMLIFRLQYIFDKLSFVNKSIIRYKQQEADIDRTLHSIQEIFSKRRGFKSN